MEEEIGNQRKWPLEVEFACRSSKALASTYLSVELSLRDFENIEPYDGWTRRRTSTGSPGRVRDCKAHDAGH